MSQFKETKEVITLHGLGFLQVKLPNKQRIHVWHPDLPRRSCFQHSSVHDHRFGFVSRVLVGTQINQFYRAVPGDGIEPTHHAYLHEGDRTRFGNRPWIKDFSLRLEPSGEEQVITVGQEYHVSPYIYHATRSEGIVVTLLTKTSEHTNGSHSLCEVGIEPDVDFDRKQWPEESLWEIFYQSFQSAVA